MKILYITSLSGKRINSFMRSAIIAAKKCGFEFIMACNMKGANLEQYKEDCEYYGIKVIHIDFERNPLSLTNLKAKKQLKHLMVSEKFDIIHCNTPIGGVLGRICAKELGQKNVIYQAHGFHFYKGAPLLNWLFYYPVEWLLSWWTDVLITINKEDYIRAKKYFHASQIEYVPGVGVNVLEIKEFSKQCEKNNIRDELRAQMGFAEDDFVIISVGEVNENKNHETIINAINTLNNKRIKYIVCGDGDKFACLQDKIINCDLQDQVFMLGHVPNVLDYLKMSDIFAFPSKREGLGVASLEAMAMGLPILTSNVHGINDYSENGKTGYKENPMDSDAFADKINRLLYDVNLRSCFGKYNLDAVKKYDISCAVEALQAVYLSINIK